MPDLKRLTLAQINPTVGAFEENAQKIAEAFSQGIKDRSDLVITPELCTIGYPPMDLMERSEVYERTDRVLEDFKKQSLKTETALCIGHISKNTSQSSVSSVVHSLDGLGARPAFNSLSILKKGEVIFKTSKSLLPNYDIFDELRHFEPSQDPNLFSFLGKRMNIAICEDYWGAQTDIPQTDLMISLSASPYSFGKQEKREKIHSEISKKLKAPFIYVNQCSATDEILFDGGSFVCDANGIVVQRLKSFSPEIKTIDLDFIKGEVNEEAEISRLTSGLIFGIREYFRKTGFKKAILGLSGGIDSAVVGTLATLALGSENVFGIAMPSQHSSSHSLEDAELLAQKLGIRFEVRPIKFMYSTMARELSQGKSPETTLHSLALENLQARLRGIVLMTLSNHENALVLSTGNKSELAMGYCTLYGDMAGALSPIGDLYKMRVYEVGRELNRRLKDAIPERSFTKAPSAELRPNQKDEDSLPPYAQLDSLLESVLEGKGNFTNAVKSNPMAPEAAHDALRKLDINEYKRKQAPPILRVSDKAFGIGRRYPIAKHWKL